MMLSPSPVIIRPYQKKSSTLPQNGQNSFKIASMGKEEFAKWLRDQLDRRGLKPSQLAAVLELNHVTVGYWVKGRYRPEAENVMRIADFFKVDRDDLLLLAGYRKGTPRDIEVAERRVTTTAETESFLKQLEKYGIILTIPSEQTFILAGRVPAGYPEVAETEAVDVIIPAHWFVLQVVGESLKGLGVEHGDQLFIDPHTTQPRPRQIVVAQLSDGTVTVKRWVPHDNYVSLEPVNHKYKSIKAHDVKVLGVVMRIMKMAP